MNITIFVDESGTIPHSMDGNDYFVIAMLFTDNSDFIKRIYKKERMKIAKKNPKLLKLLTENGEIKGSQMAETRKTPIYEKIIEKCGEHFEIGIILLNLKTCNEQMREKTARTFNFLIKRYLETYFKVHSRFKNAENIDFIIDDQNVATGAKYTLVEYLNTSLNMEEKFTESDIKADYADSKSYLLLQLIDFIANTYLRAYQKNIPESKDNIVLLKPTLCHLKEYKFPLS